MAGYLSLSFDPAQIEINKSAASDAASAAAAAQAAASAAQTAANTADSIADAAQARLSSAIFTSPTSGSRAVKNILYTSAGEIKIKYSSLAKP